MGKEHPDLVFGGGWLILGLLVLLFAATRCEMKPHHECLQWTSHTQVLYINGNLTVTPVRDCVQYEDAEHYQQRLDAWESRKAEQ